MAPSEDLPGSEQMENLSPGGPDSCAASGTSDASVYLTVLLYSVRQKEKLGFRANLRDSEP